VALSGNQPALMQARAGVARSGATRSNYYRGDAIITIEDGGVATDISKYIVHNGWQLSLNLNDDIDTATISLLPSLPFVPKTRSQVRIAFGAASNVEFAGLVMVVQRERRAGIDPRSPFYARFWYELTCVDWTALLDAHLVVAEYPTQSATTTILDIIARFTRANISTAGVPAGLESVPGMAVVNERPSTILRRITNKIGGGFYLDANRVLRAWSATVPSPMQEAPPVPLTDHLSTLKSFRSTEDASQQRTRVWVEGQRTTALLGIPDAAGMAGIEGGGQIWSMPLAAGGIFPRTAYGENTYGDDVWARVGALLSDNGQAQDPAIEPSDNLPGTTLTADVAAGATNIYVVSTAMFPPKGYAQAGGQVVWAEVLSPTQLVFLPAPLYGCLQAPLSAGTQVVAIPWIENGARDRTPAVGAGVAFAAADMRAQPQGAPVVLVVKHQDDAAAAETAARDGGDGYYEHIVQDGRYSIEGCRARADAELADFSRPTLTYEWDTEDLNAEPGRMQHIAFTEGTPLTDDVRITNVTVTPIATNHPPRRHCTATRVQPAGVVDTWVDEVD
jgi:hypothetical protein